MFKVNNEMDADWSCGNSVERPDGYEKKPDISSRVIISSAYVMDRTI